jgi:hypothetical protein
VFDLLLELSRYKGISEPLASPEASEVGWRKRAYIDRGERRTGVRDFLEAILEGRPHRPRGWYFTSDNRISQFVEYISTDRVVVKLCEGGRIIHWLLDRVDVRGVVYVVRHPCAVVASQLNRHVEEDRVPVGESVESLIRRSGQDPEPLPEDLDRARRRVETWTGVLAYQWLVDQYVPIVHQPRGPGDFRWLLLPYERILTLRDEELHRLGRYLRFTPSKSMINRLDRSSQSPGNHEPSVRGQLTKWQRYLTAEQVDEIMGIVRAGRLDFYTEDPEPDYEKMNMIQASDARW